MNKVHILALQAALDFTLNNSAKTTNGDLLDVKKELEDAMENMTDENNQIFFIDRVSLSNLCYREMYHRIDELRTKEEIFDEYITDDINIPEAIINDCYDACHDLKNDNDNNDIQHQLQNESDSMTISILGDAIVTVEEPKKYNWLRAKLKADVNHALVKKQVETYGYIDDMIDTADGLTPAECGLDPEHNISEFIKDLENL